MRALPFLAAAALASCLIACAPQAPVHDKAYFLAHADERAAAIDRCGGSDRDTTQAANCDAAADAAGQIDSGRFWAVKHPKARVANPGSL